MAYISVMAEQLDRLLRARNWQCAADRFTIRAVEPALDEIQHLWMAGEAAKMSDGEVLQVRPTRIIVPDLAPAAEVARLEAAMEASGREHRVSYFTRFVDQLWDGSRAASRAIQDAETQDSTAGFFTMEGLPGERRVNQKLKLGMDEVPDHRLLDRVFGIDGCSVVILADAGLGKTELLKWHEWRYAVFYQSADSQGVSGLPPVALRIPLRGLRTLSLDAFSHYLSHPSEADGLIPLTKIGSGNFLLELLRLRRVVLLLDGVDELMITGERLQEGLRELRKVIKDGGRIAFSSRMGHLNSISAIPATFGPAETAIIPPMPPDDGHRLLINHGATSSRAAEVLGALQSSPAQGIPLFLLMAYFVGVTKQLDREILKSRTKVLLELLRLFCERDEPRLGVLVEDQMRMLTEFAHWTSLLGDLNESDALEHLGLDPGEQDSVIVRNPHALLTRNPDGTIVFKYPQFFSLFTAKALHEDWEALGFGSVLEDFRTTKFDDATVEHLARLMAAPYITAAWMASTTDPSASGYPLVRRNLLAIALAQLEDNPQINTPRSRADQLAALLGAREISDVLFSDLVVQRIDLTGWKIARLKGRGLLSYCDNLEMCEHDDTVLAQNLDGTAAAPQLADEPTSLGQGIKRLQGILRPLRRKGLPGLIRMITFEEAKDLRGWAELGRAGYASQKKVYGERSWTIEEAKLVTLSRFAEMDSDKAALAAVQEDAELKSLILSLGQTK